MVFPRCASDILRLVSSDLGFPLLAACMRTNALGDFGIPLVAMEILFRVAASTVKPVRVFVGFLTVLSPSADAEFKN